MVIFIFVTIAVITICIMLVIIIIFIILYTKKYIVGPTIIDIAIHEENGFTKIFKILTR